jgi:hypothetical protein
MAQDYATWVNQRANILAEGIRWEGGLPYFDPAATRELQHEVGTLSPDAARFALVAALIALVGARES